MEPVTNSPYFANMNREEATSLLKKVPNLVICRKSSAKGCVVASYRSKNQKEIKHLQLDVTKEGVIFDGEGQRYPNLDIYAQSIAHILQRIPYSKQLEGIRYIALSNYFVNLNQQQVLAIAKFYPNCLFIRSSSQLGHITLSWYEKTGNVLQNERYAFTVEGQIIYKGNPLAIEEWVKCLEEQRGRKVLSQEQLPSLYWNCSSNQAKELAQQNPNHLVAYINLGQMRVETVYFSEDVFSESVLQPSLPELTSLDANDLFQSDILKPLLGEANSLDSNLAYYAQTLGLPMLYPFKRPRNHENLDYFSSDITNAQDAEHILLSQNNHKDFIIFYEDFEQDCLNVCMTRTSGCGEEEIIHLPLMQDKKGDVFYDHRFLALSTVLHDMAGRYTKSFIRCKTSYQPCLYSPNSNYSFQPLTEVVDSSGFVQEVIRHKIELDSII